MPFLNSFCQNDHQPKVITSYHFSSVSYLRRGLKIHKQKLSHEASREPKGLLLPFQKDWLAASENPVVLAYLDESLWLLLTLQQTSTNTGTSHGVRLNVCMWSRRVSMSQIVSLLDVAHTVDSAKFSDTGDHIARRTMLLTEPSCSSMTSLPSGHEFL